MFLHFIRDISFNNTPDSSPYPKDGTRQWYSERVRAFGALITGSDHLLFYTDGTKGNINIFEAFMSF